MPERLKGTRCKRVGSRLRWFESIPVHHFPIFDGRSGGAGARVPVLGTKSSVQNDIRAHTRSVGEGGTRNASERRRCACPHDILLHTHHVWLSKPVLQDRPKVTDLAAITRRHAAEVVAAIWPDRSDKWRTDREYWYDMFIARTPYEVVEDVPEDWMVRLRLLRERLIHDPLIDRLEPED